MIVQGWEVRFSSESSYKAVTRWLVEHDLASRIVDQVVQADRFILTEGWIELIYDQTIDGTRAFLNTRQLHLYLPAHTVVAVLEIDVEIDDPEPADDESTALQ